MDGSANCSRTAGPRDFECSYVANMGSHSEHAGTRQGANGVGGERLSRMPRCGGYGEPLKNNPAYYVVAFGYDHEEITRVIKHRDRLGPGAPRSARKSVLSASRGHCFDAWHQRGSTDPASRGRGYSFTADSSDAAPRTRAERRWCAARCCTRAILAQMQRADISDRAMDLNRAL